VRELVREQPATGIGRRVGALAERDVMADGVRARADRARRIGRARIVVHADVPQIHPEMRLEEGARRGVERPPAVGEHVVYGRRNRLTVVRTRARLSAHLIVFGFAGAARAPQRSARVCVRDLVRGHSHHVVGDAIGFALERIVDRSDRQLRLQDRA